MVPPVIPFKTGLVLLLGIVSAPVLKPVFEKSVKTTGAMGRRAKKIVSDTKLELKVLVAEAIQEENAARPSSASGPPAVVLQQ